MSLDIVFNEKQKQKNADNSFSNLFKKACEMGDEEFKKMEMDQKKAMLKQNENEFKNWFIKDI